MTGPEIDPRLEMAQLRDDLRRQLDELRSIGAQVARDRDTYRRDQARADAERAQQAREGALGPEIARIQQQVDLGRTSWDAVWSGADASPAAAALRARVAERADTAGAALDTYLADVADPRDVEDPWVGLAQARAQLAEVMRRAAQASSSGPDAP